LRYKVLFFDWLFKKLTLKSTDFRGKYSSSRIKFFQFIIVPQIRAVQTCCSVPGGMVM